MTDTWPQVYAKLKKHADELRTANIRLQTYHRKLEDKIEIYEHALEVISSDKCTDAQNQAHQALKSAGLIRTTAEGG